MDEQARQERPLSRRISRGELCLVAGVFVVALAVRLTVLCQSAASPTFAEPVVDADAYHQLARQLAENGHMGDGFFWQPFFYPFFLSMLYLVSGSSILLAKVVQVVVGSVTCVLTYWLGKKLLGRRIGVLAAGITAFYGPLVFFEAELLASGWAAFWATLLMLLVLKTREKASPSLWFCLGLCGALSVITRPVFLPGLVAGCAWLAVTYWRRGERGVLVPALLKGLAGFLMIAGPVALLAYRQIGQFTFLPSSGAINLYIGNNPKVCETLTARPGWAWKWITDMPLREGQTTRRQQQRFFYAKVADYAKSQPGSVAGGLGRKALQLVNSREIPRNVDIYLSRRWSRLLSALVWKVGRFGFPFGVLLPLAVIGVLSWGRRIPYVLFVLLGLYALSIVAVFVAARYRVPIIPFVSVLAAAGCVGAVEWIRRRRWKRIALGMACIAATALMAILPGPFCEERANYEAELHLYLGTYKHQKGRGMDHSIAHLSRAIELQGEYPDAHAEIGFVYLNHGHFEEAVEALTKAVKLEPRNFMAQHNLGAALEKLGSLDRAIRHYSLALEHAPYSAESHLSLGRALTKQGQPQRALDHYREAIRLSPKLVQAHFRLGDALAQVGKDQEAIEHYQEALRLDSTFQAARTGLAWVYATSPAEGVRNGRHAVILAERAAREAATAETLDVLAAAYAEAGQFDDAVRTARQALERTWQEGNRKLGGEIRKRLGLYRAGRPYRRAAGQPAGHDGP